MTKSHDREDRRGRRTMYHGATRNGASVQLDGGRLMEKAGQGTTTPATMMAESGSATRLAGTAISVLVADKTLPKWTVLVLHIANGALKGIKRVELVCLITRGGHERRVKGDTPEDNNVENGFFRTSCSPDS